MEVSGCLVVMTCFIIFHGRCQIIHNLFIIFWVISLEKTHHLLVPIAILRYAGARKLTCLLQRLFVLLSQLKRSGRYRWRHCVGRQRSMKPPAVPPSKPCTFSLMTSHDEYGMIYGMMFVCLLIVLWGRGTLLCE